MLSLLLFAVAAVPEPEPMLVELVVERLHREVLEVPQLDGRPGVPVRHLLSILGIEHHSEGDAVVGHWAGRERPFSISAAAIELHDRTIPLTSADVASADGMLFLAPAVWTEAFALDHRYDPRRLRVSFAPGADVPAVSRRLLASARATEDTSTSLHLDRVPRAMLGGHVLDWELWSANVLTPDRYADAQFRLFYGGELLGGALSLAPYGTFAQPWNPARSRAVWSFNIDQPALQRIDFGTIGGPGPWSRPMLGARITNRPRERGLGFDELGRIVTAPPNTFVRVWSDGRLVDAGETDGLGRRRVQLPTNYGSNLLRVEYIDRYGALVSEEALLRVPAAALAQGRAEYDVGFGLDRNVADRIVGGVEGAFGLLPSLTLRGGADIFVDAGVPRTYAYARAIVTPLDILTVELTAAPGTGYLSNVALRTADGWLLTASHDEYAADAARLPNLLRRRSSLATSYPLTRFGVPVALRASARETTLTTGVRSSEATAGAAIRFDTSTLMLDYDWRGDLLGGLTDRTAVRARYVAPVPFVGGAASLGAAWDLLDHHVDEVRVAYTRSLYGAWPLRLRLSYAMLEVGPGERAHEANVTFGFSWDAALTEARSYARSGGDPTVHLRAAGSLTFEDDGVVASWRPQAERGRAELHFVGAPSDAAGRVVTIGGRRYRADDDGKVFVPSLIRGRTYAIDARDPGIAAPNVVPLVPEQTFVARAHRKHVVEIPLVATGEIEGRVFMRRADGTERGVGRIRMKLLDPDGNVVRSGWTYDDGAIYLFGVPPGRYRVRLEDDQLRRLGMRAFPRERRVEIPATQDGVVVGDVGFQLSPLPFYLTEAAP
ncbi:MAG: hypothetical protein RIT81_27535 [Deltaproteobacteria bacterium]